MQGKLLKTFEFAKIIRLDNDSTTWHIMIVFRQHMAMPLRISVLAQAKAYKITQHKCHFRS